jgi:hypothetical protein
VLRSPVVLPGRGYAPSVLAVRRRRRKGKRARVRRVLDVPAAVGVLGGGVNLFVRWKRDHRKSHDRFWVAQDGCGIR